MKRSMKYKIKNISGQRVEFFSTNKNGQPETDYLEINETVRGIEPFIIQDLKFYEMYGLITITEDVGVEIDWRKEGF